MRVILVAINASYSHTNSAVRSIKYFLEQRISPTDCSVDFLEFTINQPLTDIIRGIASQKADMVLFSTYIWNAPVVCRIVPDLKKVMGDIKIGCGGPEFGYWPEGYLDRIPDLDFIISGEGEVTVKEIVEEFPNIGVKGVWFRDGGKINFGGFREPLCNLGELPFPYPDLSDPDNRLYYYESNRGCPFSCSYCMSSLDRKVRFMPLDRVFQDLQRFLDAEVRIVKFVDRTFNLDEDRYLKIWEYILDHHNGKTMFHFEIEAEYLGERALNFLQGVPPHVMQFEIGVQSSNPETLRAISRSDNVEAIARNVRRIPRTIHQHLDLIAGLPFEDLGTFSKSFDFVMDLRPDALQLGFLKVLHGTKMEEYARANGWKWMDSPAYETLSTPYMDFSDLNFLKDVETLVDAYYNSAHFRRTIGYILGKSGPWFFFSRTVETGRLLGVFDNLRREQYWFDFLAHLILGDKDIHRAWEKGGDPLESLDREILYDLLRYDFVSQGKKGNFPPWYKHIYSKDEHRALLMRNGGITNSRLDFANSEYEVFSIDPLSENPQEPTPQKKFPMLIRYGGKQN